MSADPTQTDPDRYKVIFENDRVRVLEYKDKPGERTSPHRHPDSVMYTLSSFERRLDQWRSTSRRAAAGRSRQLAVGAGAQRREHWHERQPRDLRRAEGTQA